MGKRRRKVTLARIRKLLEKIATLYLIWLLIKAYLTQYVESAKEMFTWINGY